MRSRSTIVGALLLILSGTEVAAETVVDGARGFTLTLPEGFVAAPDLVGTKPDVVHVFINGDRTDAVTDLALVIERLPGVIGRERLRMDQMPPGFQGRLFVARWGTFDVDAIELPEQIGDMQMVNYIVQIPLKPAAIQLTLAGSVDRKTELEQLLPVVLEGLKGDSNWIASALPGAPIADDPNYGTILLVIGGVVLLLGIAGLWIVSRNSERGTVLLLAVGIYAASFALGQFRVREIVMLTGVLRLLGVMGFVLGLFDYFRKRENGEPVDDEG